MRLIHTSDWHLGRTLHEHSRRHEHSIFLSWLLDLLEAERADALLIAGDVFDTSNPPAEAQADWYEFLGRAAARCPSLDIVVIGGNHDSAARLDAPDPLLRRMRVRVVGGLPRGGTPEVADEHLVVPLTNASGETAAWVAAVPFLRNSDLPPVAEEEGDPLVEGVRRVYARVLETARARRRSGQALLAMGHCYMVGGSLSELSERKILGGNQHALPVDLFPEDLAYAALGHLHMPQTVGGLERVRYSGSPLPHSLDEADYPHQVLVVDLDRERLAGVRSVPTPRPVALLRVPAVPQPVEEVLAALRALPGPDQTVPLDRWPFLEVRILLEGPVPSLREKVQEALTGRAVRLVKLKVSRAGTGRAFGDVVEQRSLADVQPEEVFQRLYASEHGREAPPDLLACFCELLQSFEQPRGVAA